MSPRPAPSYAGILRESVVAVWLGRRDLLDYALMPVIYSLALSLFIYFIADGPLLTTDAEGRPVPGDPVYFLNALVVVPTAMFVAGWIRRALHGPGGAGGLPGTVWGRSETRVMFGMIALVFGAAFVANMIGLVASMVLGPVAAQPLIAAFVVFVPTIYLLARFVLQVPAAAAGAAASFLKAWKLSAGQGHRIAFVLIATGIGSLVLTFLIVALVTMPLAAIYGGDTGIGIGGSVATSVISLLVYYAGTAVGCEALARIYRELGGPLAPPQQAAAND